MKALRRIGLTFLAAFAVVGVSNVTIASDWVLLVTSNSGNRFFVDLDSIERTGATIKAFIFVVYSQSGTSETVGYTTISEFSCSDKRTRNLQITYLREDGSSKREGMGEWQSHSLGSVGEKINADVCSYQ